MQVILWKFVEVCTLFGQKGSYNKTEVMMVAHTAPVGGPSKMAVTTLTTKMEVSLTNQE